MGEGGGEMLPIIAVCVGLVLLEAAALGMAGIADD